MQTRKAYGLAAVVAQAVQKTGDALESLVTYASSALTPSSSVRLDDDDESEVNDE